MLMVLCFSPCSMTSNRSRDGDNSTSWLGFSTWFRDQHDFVILRVEWWSSDVISYFYTSIIPFLGVSPGEFPKRYVHVSFFFSPYFSFRNSMRFRWVGSGHSNNCTGPPIFLYCLFRCHFHLQMCACPLSSGYRSIDHEKVHHGKISSSNGNRFPCRYDRLRSSF